MNQSFYKIWGVVVLIILVGGGILAWQYFGAPEEKTPTSIEYNKEGLPRFQDFLISEIYKGVPAPIDLSSDPEAPRFKTILTEGAKEGPNFAGHYTIITWGCGTECQQSGVVDSKTGKIYSGIGSEFGVEFRIDSNLFIVNPSKTIQEVYGDFEIPDWVYTAYYKWENNQFVTIFDTFDTRTADWKTYRNEGYGFEIKYPNGTQITDIDAKTGWFFLTLPSFLEPSNAVDLQLDIRVNVEKSCPSGANIPYTNINGMNFSKTDKSDDFAGMEGRAVATDYCVVKNNKVYELITRIGYGRDNPPSQSDIQKASEIFHQMLSTFKLIE